MNLKEQMKALAHEMMEDVSDSYETGDPVQAYNALNRLKVGVEALHLLAMTATQLDYLDGR